MVNKSGQMKIQQMTFMLIAVTLFFVLVGLFLLAVSFSGIKESATELCKENAMSLAAKVANSPEFSCGEAFGTEKVNCVDADKAMSLTTNANKYKDFWGISDIEIRKIYPAENEKACTKSNYPDCNKISILSDNKEGVYVSNYVSLCRKASLDGDTYDKCELALIRIKYSYGEKC